MCVYSALGLLAVRSIYISTLGFLLVMLLQKGFKAWLMCRTCVARTVPCTIYEPIRSDRSSCRALTSCFQNVNKLQA